MNTPTTISWKGYNFTSYNPDNTDWNEVPGIYIFAGLSSDRRWWAPKYIGRTLSFKDRLGSGKITHERWPQAKSLGATHVHARVEHDETQCRFIEFLLINAYKPPMNAT